MPDARERGRRIALGLLALPAAAALAPATAAAQVRMARPEAPYVTKACPFECCTYGEWRFPAGAELRAAPSLAAAIVGRIPADARVRADSGHVRVDTLGVVLVRRDFRDPDVDEQYEAGDTLLVLDYLGEGFSNVWVRGERRQLTLVHVLSSYGPPVGADTAAMAELRAPAATWWAHVTIPLAVRKEGATDAAAPRRGWVHMSPDVDVQGADACGGPG